MRGPDGIRIMTLDRERVTIGKASANDLVIDGDPQVSRLHAALEHFEAGWVVRDLGSRNGTFLNGERILSERQLHDGDELQVGNTSAVFRSKALSEMTATQAPEAPPELTRREREVLVALCRPVLSGSMFTRPASIKQIAADLVVSENAVKQHLGRLYDKFQLYEGTEPRTLDLANEAIRRGAVKLADLRRDR